ncbi:Asx homology domain-containing protein [Mycena sp. CBHHK59/15]|nr:Asx homology domain-containing protein [Mycena sp. CBHHK59/15]
MADQSLAPRRSARKVKPTQIQAPVETVPAKRKAKAEPDPAEQLHNLLQNPKSRLTKMDISDLINVNSWNMLSPESQSVLSTLLPPTAFRSFQPSLAADHPAAGDSMKVDSEVLGSPDTSVFTDAHFLAAAHTFQDHLYSNWLSDAHADKVKKYEQGTKTEVLLPRGKTKSGNATINQKIPREAAELKLVDLAKNSVLRKGDVIAYRRNFSNLNIVVEKDVIIQSIHPRNHSLTVLIEPGTTRDLPVHLLMPNPSDPSDPTRSMTVMSPSQLETGLLDIDGRVERARRPNGNAWKSLTLWRWRGDPSDYIAPQGDRRGGREDHGTLFYLRGCYYQDR